MEDQKSVTEEVFFGQLSQAEILKRQQLFGPNYSTPPLGNTPRPRNNVPSKRRPGVLPDVLRQLHFNNFNVQSPHSRTSALNSSVSSSEDVIMLESDDQDRSNSVITISDDESFQLNDGHNGEDGDKNKESICGENSLILNASNETGAENSSVHKVMSEETLDSIDIEIKEIHHIPQSTLNHAGSSTTFSTSFNNIENVPQSTLNDTQSSTKVSLFFNNIENVEINNKGLNVKINCENENNDCVMEESDNNQNDSKTVNTSLFSGQQNDCMDEPQELENGSNSLNSTSFDFSELNKLNKTRSVDSEETEVHDEHHNIKSVQLEISSLYEPSADPKAVKSISSANHTFNGERVEELNISENINKMTVEENIEHKNISFLPIKLSDSVTNLQIVDGEPSVCHRFLCEQVKNSVSADSFINQEVEEIIENPNSPLTVKHDNSVGDPQLIEHGHFPVNHDSHEEQLEESKRAQSISQHKHIKNIELVNENVEQEDGNVEEEYAESLSVLSNDNVFIDSSLNSKLIENDSFSVNYKIEDQKYEEPENVEIINNQEFNEGSFEKVSSVSTISVPKVSFSFSDKSQEISKNEEKVNNRNGDKSQFNLSGLDVTEYLLNGVTDSVLNCSYGSSLPSPPEDPNSPAVIRSAQHEDISYEGENLTNVTQDLNVNHNYVPENDLHMSVDEFNYQQQDCSESLGIVADISQPSEYKSCSSAFSSFSTAFNDKPPENSTVSGQSDTFHNYRDVCDDSVALEETDKISFKSDEELVNEASFQIVMQNRQNSFSSTSITNRPENIKESHKSKPVSKLPVYHNTASLLRQPKLCVKPDTLKTSSYKLAKSLAEDKTPSKSQIRETKPASSTNTKPSSLKRPLNSPLYPERKIPTLKSFNKTPAKISVPAQNSLHVVKIIPLTPLAKSPSQNSSSSKIKTPQNFSSNKNKTAQNSSLEKSKTSALNSSVEKSKTPALNSSVDKSIISAQNANSAKTKTPTQKNISTHIPRLVKSDTKEMRGLTPLSKSKKYKNVISPIHAYINSSPAIYRTKAQTVTETRVYGQDNTLLFQTKASKDSPVKTSKAVQRLQYEDGQENMNPNVIDPNRETLPMKVLEGARAVFWKETEKPQSHLPKMGEKLTNILLNPTRKEVKITVHEGRVMESPKTKGVLVASSSSELTEDSQSSDESKSRISVRLQKSAEIL